ncbi:MAG: O-antigen ligase family protein [bacterium]|nr:O-antigen ligase family protein [bacterium]
MLYLITIFTLLFFLLAWRRLDWAVMFLIAALPAYLIRFSIFGLPATLLEVMIWVVFIVWFIKNYKWIFNNIKLRVTSYELRDVKRYPFDWEIALLMLVALLAVGVAGFSNSSFGVWKAYFFEPALFYIVVFNVMQGAKGREKIMWSLAVSALAVSVLAIYQKITGQLIDNELWAAAETRRAVSFFGYPNAVGLYLGPIILLLLGWLVSVIASDRRERSNDKIWAVLIFLTIIVSALSIYFAKSKGALLGVAAGLIVFGLLAGKKARIAVAALILIMAAVILMYQPARNLTYDTVTFKTISGQIRLAGWQDSWTMLSDGRLITGAGLANFQNAVKPYHTEGIFFKDPRDPEAQRKLVFNEAYRNAHWQPLEIYLYPHNIVLNFWSELGLAGLLLFVWIILKYFWLGIANWRVFKNNFFNIGLISAMVVIVVHGIVDVPYFKNDLALMFWLLAAMMGAIKLESVNN